MKGFVTSLAALVVAVQAAKVELSSIHKGSSSAAPIPGHYVVELAHPGGLRRSEAPHAAVFASLRARGVPIEVKKEFNVADIFVGASVVVAVRCYTISNNHFN